MAKRCRHCRRGLACRPRRLCTRCYSKPQVRSRYARRPARGGSELLKFSEPDRPVPQPTTALPGSAEKIAVLRRRVELGQELFHPEDAAAADWWFAKVG